jgi:hypothetical protein
VAPLSGFEGGQPLHRRLPKFGFVSKAADRAQVRTSELNKSKAGLLSAAEGCQPDNQHIQRKSYAVREVTQAVTLKGIAVTKGARAGYRSQLAVSRGIKWRGALSSKAGYPLWGSSALSIRWRSSPSDSAHTSRFWY